MRLVFSHPPTTHMRDFLVPHSLQQPFLVMYWRRVYVRVKPWLHSVELI